MSIKTIGEKVREKIDAKGMKIYFMCEKTGLSRESLSQRMSSTHPLEFRPSELIKISEILGLPSDYNWFAND